MISALCARIKAATRDLVKLAGGVERSAQYTRVSKSQIGNYSNVDQPTDYMPADIIADLEREVGSPIVTRELALIAGYTLMPIVVLPAESGFGAHLARVLRETGDVMSTASAAFADDKLTERERRTLDKDISEAIGALSAAQAFLNQERS